MECSVIYEEVLNQIRKDKRGGFLKIEEFNKHIRLVDKRLLIAFCSRYEDDIEISSHMGFLKVVDFPVSLTAGLGILPADYFRMSGDPWYTDSAGVVRRIDVVTSKEDTYRERDYITKASLKYPTCVIGSQDSQKRMQIRVRPTTISTIYVSYVRSTTVPFLDYYVNNTTLKYVYLAQGAQNVVIPTGCTYRDGTTGIKNSLSVDSEWDEHEMPWLVAYMLQSIGAQVPDELLLQVGITQSKEIQTGQIW